MSFQIWYLYNNLDEELKLNENILDIYAKIENNNYNDISQQYIIKQINKYKSKITEMNRIKNIIDIQLETIHYLESNKNNDTGKTKIINIILSKIITLLLESDLKIFKNNL